MPFITFGPSDATAILRNAVGDRQPLLLFEVSDRRLANVLSILLVTPLLVLLSAFLIRPFRWRRLLFCTLVPAVPFVCTWDGVVSQLRAYNVGELQAMANSTVRGAPYAWSAGHVPTGLGVGRLTYLVGWPL